MPNNEKNRGDSNEQHVKAGQQSHKNNPGQQMQDQGKKGSQQGSESTRGGSHEQHVKAGEQSHKNNR
jgi:hypothetical protein